MAGPALTNEHILRLHGSNTLGAKLAPELITAWMLNEGFQINLVPAENDLQYSLTGQHEDGSLLRVEIQATGSSDGFKSLTRGNADIGMSSRPIQDGEIDSLKKLGGFDTTHDEHVIALDGIAIIVNKTNPIRQLSIQQIKNVFSGKIRTWSELGWESGRKINLYARDDHSGTYDMFKNLVLGKAQLSKDADRYQSTHQLEQDVSLDIASIGFIAFPYAKNTLALAVNHSDGLPLAPNEFRVATEDYPLARRLYFYVPPANRNALINSFLEYVQSDTAQQRVTQVGFISQKPFSAPIDLPPIAPEDYQQFVTGAERLSINLRFGNGRTILDSKALRDLHRIQSFMRQPENQSKQLLLMGFSDKAESSPYMALSLSNQRVDYVAKELIKLGIAPRRVRGFGQAMPVSENNSEDGRMKNRRVEIWIKHNI